MSGITPIHWCVCAARVSELTLSLAMCCVLCVCATLGERHRRSSLALVRSLARSCHQPRATTDSYCKSHRAGPGAAAYPSCLHCPPTHTAPLHPSALCRLFPSFVYFLFLCAWKLKVRYDTRPAPPPCPDLAQYSTHIRQRLHATPASHAVVCASAPLLYDLATLFPPPTTADKVESSASSPPASGWEVGFYGQSPAPTVTFLHK